MKNTTTKKFRSKRAPGEMKAEYDFSAGVRGKYLERYEFGTNVVLLEPESSLAFPDSKSVNEALRALLAITNNVEARKRH
jgi:hypothetical protein